MGKNIAYLLSRFPHLPETFILRELNELEKLGWQVSLYPLIRQKGGLSHAEAQAWLERAHYLPWLSLAIVVENLRALFRRPLDYLRLVAESLWGNLSSLYMLLRAAAIFPKAVYAARMIEDEGIEHIHAHYATHPAFMAWVIHRLTGISYSVTVHAHDIFVRQTMLSTKLGEAAFIIAISDYNRNYLSTEVSPTLLAKTHVVHCGVDSEKYVSAEPRSRKAAERFELIHIGSLQAYKGQQYLIEACQLLLSQGITFRCRIVGDGEERPRLQNMITRMGLTSQVELLGARPQSEIPPLLASADCYLQPSIVTPSGKMEGIPVALMEAMASGLPVIATDISGIPELVQPGKTGILVPPADAGALCEAILQLYTQPSEAAKLASAGRQFVLREFELHVNIQQLSSHFISVISAGSAG